MLLGDPWPKLEQDNMFNDHQTLRSMVRTLRKKLEDLPSTDN